MKAAHWKWAALALVVLYLPMLIGSTAAQDIALEPAVEVVVTDTGPLTVDLTTITGIVALTLVITQVVKRLFANLSVLKNAPTWAIAVVVAVLLALVANKSLGLLEGDLVTLLWQAAVAALAASGFYSWMDNPKADPESSAKSRAEKKTARLSPPGPVGSIFLVGVMALSMTGCATQSQTQQYRNASNVYNAAVEVVTALGNAEVIDLDGLETFELIRVEVNNELDAMRDAIIAGDTFDFQFALRRFNAALSRLVQEQLRLEREADDGRSGSNHTFDRSYENWRIAIAHYQERARGKPRSYSRRVGSGGRDTFTSKRRLRSHVAASSSSRTRYTGNGQYRTTTRQRGRVTSRSTTRTTRSAR